MTSISSSSVSKLPVSPLSKKFSHLIAEWFVSAARDLPWRKTSDAYKIWISEIMCQQTTVATVIPYYERFLKEFPKVEALAAATEDRVLKFWEGLGYYSRARNLRRAAQLVVEKFNSRIPETRDEIQSLPGIGAYSAGAILSIAYRKPEAALDGNLIRVYSRLLAVKEPVDQVATLKHLWEVARNQVPEDESIRREFTEGMMELGATVCTPRKPQCARCPVQKMCKAFDLGIQETLPIKAKKSLRKKKFEVVHILKRGSSLAFFARGADSKYPSFQRLPFEALEDLPKKSSGWRMKYSVTDRDFLVEVQTLSKVPSSLRRKIKWHSEEEIEDLLLPAIDRKILKKLRMS